MVRNFFYKLKKWKDKTDRESIIIWDTRQTSKTCLMKDFVLSCYEQVKLPQYRIITADSMLAISLRQSAVKK